MVDPNLYGSAHSILNADIGEAIMRQQISPNFGMSYGTSYIRGNGILGTPILKGALESDTVELNQKEKSKQTCKNIFFLGALALGGFFTLKSGKKMLLKIKGIFKPKNGESILSKVKTMFTPKNGNNLLTKCKNLFKKS